MYRNGHINDLVVVLYLCTFDGFQHRLYRPLHVHGDVDNFVDELQLDESPRFFWTPHWHINHLVNVLLLWALGAYGKLFVLCLDLVSFSAPSF